MPYLEADLGAPELAATYGTAGASLPISYKLESDHIVIFLSGSNEDTTSAVRHFKQSLDFGALRDAWPSLGAKTHGGLVAEVDRAMRPDATVEEITAELSRLFGLPDRDMARLFPGEVHRETYQRWRTGRMANPTPANRRRMGVLLRLFDDLSRRGLATTEWVRNPSNIDDLNPYELLVQGRLDEVEALAAKAVPVVSGDEVTGSDGRPVIRDEGLPAFIDRDAEGETDLEFDDDLEMVEFEGDAEPLDD